MVGAIAVSVLLLAQPAPNRPADQVVEARAIIATIESNQRALDGYRWRSRVEVSVAGEVVDVDTFDARLDDDGSLIRTRTDDPGADRGVSSKRRKPGRRQKKIDEVRSGLEALVPSYVRLEGKRLSSSFAGARVTAGNGGAVQFLQAHDVVRTGDSMKIRVDGATRLPRRYEIVSSLEGEPVRVVAEFVDLELGPTYPARIVVETEIKEDPMVVTTQNFDYSKP